MDIIYESADNFIKLEHVKYHFVFVRNRKSHNIVLDFKASDFRHAIGLHHVTDIAIEKNPVKMIKGILCEDKPIITDDMLAKSRKYKEIASFTGSIQQRVSDMRFLEKCLDTSDFMRIYEAQPFGSFINADYFVEAHCKEIGSNIYIFIRKRKESENYVVVSYFRKMVPFKGISTYWLLKEKISDKHIEQLYRNPSYKY